MDEFTMADCTYPSMEEGRRNDSHYATTKFGEGRNAMASRGGRAIACKMDAGRWDVSGATGCSTHSYSCDGWDKVFSLAGLYSTVTTTVYSWDVSYSHVDFSSKSWDKVCSQAGHYSCLEPACPSTSFRWSRLGICASHLSRLGGCLPKMQGDVSTSTLCLSSRETSKHVMFTTEDDFGLCASVLPDLRLGLDRGKLQANLINMLLASMGEGEGRREIEECNNTDDCALAATHRTQWLPSRGALQLPRDDKRDY